MVPFMYFLSAVLALTPKTFVKAQADFETTGNFRASRYASVTAARGAIFDAVGGDLLVVSRGSSRIISLFEENSQVETVILVENATLALNHGIATRDGFLYASSTTTVFRWPYTPGQRTPIIQGPETVIKSMPAPGHSTRTLIFDREGKFYVSIGSNANVDPDSSRARIRRFELPATIPAGGIEFGDGEVFADGLRNEVGLAFDSDDILWGVQNGADGLIRGDLGADIQNNNPADELTKYDKAVGTHYGYPYCWTVDELQGHEHGEQFAWPDFMNDDTHSDDWCKNTTNNQPPTLPLPAHCAALGITFYDGSACNSTGAFPCSMTGDAFVAFHASGIREPPAGHRVVHIPINPDTRLPTGEILDVMYDPNPVGCGSIGRCFRPVNLLFDANGHLFVTADASGEVFRLTYDEN